MASSISQQVALTVLAILLGSCASRRPSAEPELSWMDQDQDRDRDRDHPDALDDGSQQTGCFPGSCGPAGGAAGAAYGNDLDMEVVDPPSAGKRTASLQEICDNIAVDRGVAALLRTAVLSCPCDLGNRILQVGESHYPRHLNVANCMQSSRCRTRSYRVPLLTRRSGSGQAASGQDHDGSLDDAPLVPESLRKHWRFELKSIPVACDCVP